MLQGDVGHSPSRCIKIFGEFHMSSKIHDLGNVPISHAFVSFVVLASDNHVVKSFVEISESLAIHTLGLNLTHFSKHVKACYQWAHRIVPLLLSIL